MLRRCLRRLQVDSNPEMHRFAEGTFKDGAHRNAPNKAHQAWSDVRSPLARIKMWAVIPQTTLSVAIAWSSSLVLFYYSFCLGMDARSTYLANNCLQRELHVSTAQAVSLEKRLNATQTELDGLRSGGKGAGGASVAMQQSSSTDAGLTNYEYELRTERSRNKHLVERNSHLVGELDVCRAEMRSTSGDLFKANGELAKMRVLLKKLAPNEQV
jgi:hypothetical protein